MSTFNQISRRALVTLLAGSFLAGRSWSREGPTRASVLLAPADTTDRDFFDPATKRLIRIRLRLPPVPVSAPLIVYLPGLGMGVSAGLPWCEAWQAAGFAVATISHPLSNEAIWDTPRRSQQRNLRVALATTQYQSRVRDLAFVSSKLLDHAAVGIRLDATKVGIAGHSLGALTALDALRLQAAGRWRGPAFKAVAALSPGGQPFSGAKLNAALFCITGEMDDFVVFGRTSKLGVPLEKRLAVYRSAPSGSKYLVVLKDADHMTFAGETLDNQRYSRRAKSEASDGANWEKVARTTTAFWQYHLDTPANMLRDDYLGAVKAELSPGDRFEAG